MLIDLRDIYQALFAFLDLYHLLIVPPRGANGLVPDVSYTTNSAQNFM